MLGNQQGKVGILGLFFLALVAVAVYCNDAIRIFINNDTVRIHTERADIILKFLRTIDDLALIQLIRQMGEDHGRDFDTDTDIDTVGLCRDIQLLTDMLHPLAAAAANGNDTLFAAVALVAADYTVAILIHMDRINRCVKIEIHRLAEFFIQIFQHNIVDIRAQMAHRCIQKLQFVLDTDLFKLRTGCREKAGSLTAVLHVDIIHIVHQIQRFLTADMLIECAAEIVSDIVFSIGKSTGSAETAHDRTGLAVDTGLDLVTVDRTFSLV